MRLIDRLVAGAVLLMAVAGILVASSGTATANGQYCVWNFTCPPCAPGTPSWQCDACTLDSYSCSRFVAGDCDASCDWEYTWCQDECQGPVQTCTQQCNQIYIACIGSCIPKV